ncbi:CBS domain-containing protein [Hippea jasoniae]|uniref:CBS domain-containing protein n=1 Tax=Hippea jasoniae TaxID=944479 RepID=UPI0005580D04|nr:CBS domain-containing protein [Hippea jasoniae]
MKVITTHKNPDFDAIASCIAAKKLYPDAIIMLPKLQFSSQTNFMIQLLIYEYVGNTEEEIENIDTLIVVDTHSSSRIEDKLKPFLKKAKIICFDHHKEGDINCDQLSLVNYGANTTQLIQRIIKNDIEIDEEDATLFMLGIYADTGRLTYTNTKPEDIEVCAYLLRKGADLETIKEVLEETLTETEVYLLNELAKNKRIFEVKGIRIGLSFANLDYFSSNAALTVSKFIEMDKLDAAVGIFRMGSRIYVIGRSKNKDIDIAHVLKNIGGGGHPFAASATIKNATLIEVAEKLSSIIKETLLDRITAEDIMTSPPKYVYSQTKMEKVNKIISTGGINALVVVNKATKKVEGIITRQVINKAIYHGMGNKPTGLFVDTEIKTVDINERFSTIKRIVLEEKQRLIPVVSDGVLVGVITRTNILKILTESSERDVKLKKKNIAAKIKQHLPQNIYNYLIEIGNTAKQMGFNAYLVGGVVRDIILGFENLDIDIVIEGDGIEFAKQFAKLNNARVATHERFRTATIIMPDSIRVDIATAREEYYDLPGSLPTVQSSSIKLDLYRRDFTINTLAVKLHDEFGDLLDFFGGLNDIENKKIRILHMLSFIEDPTRMYRAVRFATRLGFEIGKQTDRLIKVAVDLNVIKNVEPIRIYNEIVHILNTPDVSKSFELLKKYRLIRALNKKLIIEERILKALDEAEEILKSCEFFCGSKKIKKEYVFLIVLEYLFRNSASFVEAIGADEQTKNFIIKASKKIAEANGILSAKGKNKFTIYETLSKLPIEAVLAMYALNLSKDAVVVFLKELIHIEPLIKGRDLIKLGLKPSKLFGEIINEIFKLQLLEKMKDKLEALKYIEKKYLEKKHGTDNKNT